MAVKKRFLKVWLVETVLTTVPRQEQKFVTNKYKNNKPYEDF